LVFFRRFNLKINRTIAAIIILLITLAIGFAGIPSGYYDAAAGKSGQELKTALNSILNTNLTRVSYGDARYILAETDRDPNNSSNCILVYLGTSVSGNWDGGITWNREHVWPQSLLGVNVENQSINVGSDLHNLKPADPNENSSRGNKYYANQTTSDSYAPRNAVKGDLARILFYMVVMYESSPDLELVNRTPNIYEMALLDVLLEWHVQDPVDDFERNRNEVIYTYQHNRNPFIDHPEYVDLIWGNNLPPAAPSQLTASAITYTSVILNWTDNSTDESGFRIYQNDSLITTTAANVTGDTVTNLLPGQSYTFGVSAWNGHGESTAATVQIITLSDDTTGAALFFSEYIEGSSNNKALEITNGAPNAIHLDEYVILQNTNNGLWQSINHSFPAGTILNHGQVWVIAYYSADQSILAVADEVISSTVANFNGDDVRALVKISGNDTTFLDIIGAYRDSTYNSNGWPVAGVSGATKDHTLVRKSTVRQGNPDWAGSAGTNADDSEWIVYEQDTFSYLGTHTLDSGFLAGHSGNRLESFRLFPAYPNPFNSTTHLRFEIPDVRAVTISIFNLNGQLIEKLDMGNLGKGKHEFRWLGFSYVSGIYIYQIRADDQIRNGKFLLLK